jgi:hypothetical protein
MSKSAINTAYAQSLLWVALFMAIAGGVANIVQLLFVDFIHGNPHRTQDNALFMMAAFAPVVGVAALVGSFLVFALPQFFQAMLIGVLGRPLGPRARFVVLPALPLTAILTWTCYYYLIPADFNVDINPDPDGTPYQHGLTLARYLKTLAIQAPITLFSFWHFDAGFRGRSRKPAVLAALAFALVVGGIMGYVMAVEQYQFL